MAFCTHFYLVFSKKWSNFALVIEIDRHIEILLLDNDCVIIPNFGGFVAHHVEARYDESEASFLPPIRTLGFNPHLKNINDSLLAQSYVEAYDISYPEAQRAIAADVDCIKEQLSEKGEYELKNIGVLSLNGAEDIVFTPCEAGILTPNLYGLGAVTVNKLVNNNETVAEKGIGIPTGEKTKDFTADSAMTISRPTEEPDATVLNDEDHQHQGVVDKEHRSGRSSDSRFLRDNHTGGKQHRQQGVRERHGYRDTDKNLDPRHAKQRKGQDLQQGGGLGDKKRGGKQGFGRKGLEKRLFEKTSQGYCQSKKTGLLHRDGKPGDKGGSRQLREGAEG